MKRIHEINVDASPNTALVIDDVLIFGRSICHIDNHGHWKGLLNTLCFLSKSKVFVAITHAILKFMC